MRPQPSPRETMQRQLVTSINDGSKDWETRVWLRLGTTEAFGRMQSWVLQIFYSGVLADCSHADQVSFLQVVSRNFPFNEADNDDKRATKVLEVADGTWRGIARVIIAIVLD
jgi:hypothetical protein